MFAVPPAFVWRCHTSLTRLRRAYGFPYLPYGTQKSGSKAKRNFSPTYAPFSPRVRSLLRRTLKNTNFFIAFLFNYIHYIRFFLKSQRFLSHFCFNKSRISAKSLVFAIAFSSARRASSAAFSAAIRSSSAFAAAAAASCAA